MQLLLRLRGFEQNRTSLQFAIIDNIPVLLVPKMAARCHKRAFIHVSVLKDINIRTVSKIICKNIDIKILLSD
jgi:RNase adaptor protein for sRNA GlmZ degradation